MKKWEIYEIFQPHVRNNTHPPIPNDRSPKSRMFLVIAEPIYPAKAMCCPIQNCEKGIFTGEVKLDSGCITAITKDCKVICHEIYTFESQYFKHLKGELPDIYRPEIQANLSQILEL